MGKLNAKRAAEVATAAAKGEKPPPKPPKPEYEPRVLSLRQLFDQSVRRATGPKRRVHCTTGHHLLDTITGGHNPGDVWLIGARTSVGKSSWLCATTDENLKAGKRVLIVTGEDHEDRYAARLMCRRAGVNAYRYRDQCLTDEEKREVRRVRDAAPEDPVYLDARGMYVEDVEAQIAWLVAEHGFDFVQVDYLQSFGTKRRGLDTPATVRHVGRTLIDVMHRSGAAGALYTQLTIADQYTKPTVEHVRDNKDMGMFCDVAAFIYELEKGRSDTSGNLYAPAGSKMMVLDKVKDGEAGAVAHLDWRRWSAAFAAVTKAACEAGFCGDVGRVSLHNQKREPEPEAKPASDAEDFAEGFEDGFQNYPEQMPLG